MFPHFPLFEERINEKHEMQHRMQMKKILETAIAVALILAVAIIMIFYRPVSLGGDTHYLTVLTGSMTPTLPVGSVIAIKPADFKELKEGDIISFEISQQLVTHRIINFTDAGVTTKGDANETPDKFVVHKADIIGKVAFCIPYFGYLSHFVKTPLGFTLLIILPATIIIAREARNIINHRKTTDEQKDKIASSTRRKK